MHSCTQKALFYEFTKQQWPVNNIMPLQRKAIDFLISLDISLFLLNLYFCGPTAFSPSTWSVHPVKATTITKTLPGISGFSWNAHSVIPKLHKFASKTKTKMAKILHYQCQVWPNMPNIHITVRILARYILSGWVSLKRSCKTQLRRVGLRSIGPSSQKLQPNLIFGPIAPL